MLLEPILVVLLSLAVGLYAKAHGHGRWRYFLLSFLGWYFGELLGFLAGAGIDVLKHGHPTSSRPPFVGGVLGVVVVYPVVVLILFRRLRQAPTAQGPAPPHPSEG